MLRMPWAWCYFCLHTASNFKLVVFTKCSIFHFDDFKNIQKTSLIKFIILRKNLKIFHYLGYFSLLTHKENHQFHFFIYVEQESLRCCWFVGGKKSISLKADKSRTLHTEQLLSSNQTLSYNALFLFSPFPPTLSLCSLPLMEPGSGVLFAIPPGHLEGLQMCSSRTVDWSII